MCKNVLHLIYQQTPHPMFYPILFSILAAAVIVTIVDIVAWKVVVREVERDNLNR